MKSILLAAGSNSRGQLGLGHDRDEHSLQECQYDQGSSFPPVGWKVMQLCAGSNHTLALLCSDKDDGDEKDGITEIWGCGSRSQGQLGKQEDLDRRMMKFQRLDLQLNLVLDALMQMSEEEIHQWRPVRIACGWNASFIILRHRDNVRDDVLVVLGKDNDFGQLGIGEKKWSEIGVNIVRLRQGEDDIRGTLCIGGIACGLRHAVVQCRYTDKEGINRVQVLGWGAARHRQLDTESAAIKFPSMYRHAHLVAEWKDSSGSVVNLAAGKEHTVYRCGDGSLRIIGSNRQGQRIVGDALVSASVLSAACTWNATLVLLKDSILGSGNNDKGQLGAQAGSDGVASLDLEIALKSAGGKKLSTASLVCGSEHSVVLLRDNESIIGQVWGWGWNEHGNLAQNNEEDQRDPVCIWPLHRSNADYQSCIATDVWAGCGTTFIQIRSSNAD